MKKLLLFALLCVPIGLHAQQGGIVLGAQATTTCSAPSNAVAVVAISGNQGGASFTVTANASGNTISFFASGDNQTSWAALNVTASNSQSPVTTTTGTGTFQANVAGYTHVCMEISTLVSGTATVSIRPASASARAGGTGLPAGCTSIPNVSLTCPQFIATSSFLNVGASAQELDLYTAGACNGVSACTGFKFGFLAPPSMTASVIEQLPATDGTAGQVLQTNGSAALSWGAIGPPTNTFILSNTTGCNTSAQCYLTSGNTVEITDATITNSSATVTSAGQANWTSADVGKRIWGFSTCNTSLIGTQATIIGAAQAFTIMTVNSATSIALSTTATGSSGAGTGCVIYGTPDDTAWASAETAVNAANYCPKLMLGAMNMMWTSWHMQTLDPTVCHRAGTYTGQSIVASGFDVEGQGYRQSVIFIDPLLALTACTKGAANGPPDSTTINGGFACMILPQSATWRHFGFDGGGNTRTTLTGGKALIQAGAMSKLEGMSFINYGDADNNLVGLYVSEGFGPSSTTNYGGLPVYCVDTLFDGFGSDNVKMDPGVIQSKGCSYQDSLGGTAKGSSVVLANGGSGVCTQAGSSQCSSFDSQGGNHFFGSGANQPTGVAYILNTCANCFVRLTSGDECWSNGQTNVATCYSNTTAAGTFFADEFSVYMPGPVGANVGINLGFTGGTANVMRSLFVTSASGNWATTVAGTHLFDNGGNTYSSGTLSAAAGTLSGPNVYNGSCTGTASAASTLGLYQLGENTATTCTSTTVGLGVTMSTAGTVDFLSVSAGTGGTNASSGVFTVLKNGALQTVTCTTGTGTSCSDTAHSFAVAIGDIVSVQFTTQTAETLANVKVNVHVAR